MSPGATNAANGLSCYVYYRIAPQCLPQARAAVAELLEAVRRSSGIRGSVSERTEIRKSSPIENVENVRAAPTWMETYSPVAFPEGFEGLLQAAVRVSGIEQWLAPGQGRTIEWFAPMETPSPCA